MKKTVTAILAVALLFLLTACGAETKTDSLPLTEVYEQITAAVPPDYETVAFTSDDMMYLYGIDGSKLTECVAVQDACGYKSEIVILKAADAASAKEMATHLEQHIEDQKDSMRSYDANQFAVLEKTKVTVKGNYVAMFISESQDEMLQIFDEAV